MPICKTGSWIRGFPLTWHLRKETAGYGPHGDLNSHSVDLARYLVGEIKTVQCTMANFIRQRSLPDEEKETAFEAAAAEGQGEVSVDDASFMIVEFDNGALGSFEATRFAPGRKNYNYFEIYGSKGSLSFNLERMNELQVFSREDEADSQGFKTIMVTESAHPYISAWWPPGHMSSDTNIRSSIKSPTLSSASMKERKWNRVSTMDGVAWKSWMRRRCRPAKEEKSKSHRYKNREKQNNANNLDIS